MEEIPLKTEYMFKIIVIGDAGVGKTSLIKRYVNGMFSANYKATIGVDFSLKVIESSDKVFRLQFWDISGQERFGDMTRVYYRDAVAAIICFDLTRETTLEGARKWKADVNKKLGEDGTINFPCILMGCKSDLVSVSPVTKQENIDELTSTEKFLGNFKVSSKTSQGVDLAMEYLVKHLIKVEKPFIPHESTEPKDGLVVLDSNKKPRQKSNENCCN